MDGVEAVEKPYTRIQVARSLGDRLNFMPDPLPKFNKPPVVETVLSAQFAPLPKFRTAYAGCFWKSKLDAHWNSVEETARLDDQFEKFGEERKWGPMGGIRFVTGMESQRTQIARSDNTRMIQIQDTRFIYNWKKGENGYPSYEVTRSEFEQWYAEFKESVGSLGLGEVSENQWEVTYINHLNKTQLWNTPRDWPLIFPWFNFPQSSFEPDSTVSRWALDLPENRGRLHVHFALARIAPNGPDAIVLELTARGPVSSKPGFGLIDGFEIGHEAIVRSFTAMTSKLAHDSWERTV
jgi:uncharacterized protein (TIGR04255 family)